MSEEFVKGSDKVSFKEIVLRHLNKILELSTHEFRGGYREERLKGNQIIYEYIPSASSCYIQAVDSLHDILLPHFDKEINISIKKIKDGWDSFKPKTDKENIKEELDCARRLFQQLNLLLNRKKYLKAAVYEE